MAIIPSRNPGGTANNEIIAGPNTKAMEPFKTFSDPIVMSGLPTEYLNLGVSDCICRRNARMGYRLKLVQKLLLIQQLLANLPLRTPTQPKL